MTECFYNKFHPTLPQCNKEGRPLPETFLKTGNGTDFWTWCVEHSQPFTRDPEPVAADKSSGDVDEIELGHLPLCRYLTNGGPCNCGLRRPNPTEGSR